MRPTVYIETTIPSYYCDERPSLVNEIARPREWWDRERADYECFVSLVVLDELSSGSYPRQSECVALIDGLPLLTVEKEVISIAEAYRAQNLMPKDPGADAVHRGPFLLLSNGLPADVELSTHRQCTESPPFGDTQHEDGIVDSRTRNPVYVGILGDRTMSSESPIIDEVRQRRHEISERFGHDLQAYYRHLKELEEKYRDRVVSQITVVAPRPPEKPK